MVHKDCENHKFRGRGSTWSPLTLDKGTTLSTNQWKQSWRDFLGVQDPSQELNKSPASSTPNPPVLLSRVVPGPGTSLQTSNVTGLAYNFWNFTKDSPAFLDTTFTTHAGDSAMQFAYQFIQPGQGDQLTVWVDNALMFVVTGELAGTDQQIGSFDISDLSPGPHTIDCCP